MGEPAKRFRLDKSLAEDDVSDLAVISEEPDVVEDDDVTDDAKDEADDKEQEAEIEIFSFTQPAAAAVAAASSSGSTPRTIPGGSRVVSPKSVRSPSARKVIVDPHLTPQQRIEQMTSTLSSAIARTAIGRRIYVQYCYYDHRDARALLKRYEPLKSSGLLETFYKSKEFAKLVTLYDRNRVFLECLVEVHELSLTGDENATRALEQIKQGSHIWEEWTYDLMQRSSSSLSMLQFVCFACKVLASATSQAIISFVPEKPSPPLSGRIDKTAALMLRRVQPFLKPLSAEEESSGILKQFQQEVDQFSQDVYEWKSWILLKTFNESFQARSVVPPTISENLLKLLQEANVIVSQYKLKDIQEKKGVFCNCECVLLPEAEAAKVCGFKKAQAHWAQLEKLWAQMVEEIQKECHDIGVKIVGYPEVELIQECLQYFQARLPNEAKKHEAMRASIQQDWAPVDHLIRVRKMH